MRKTIKRTLVQVYLDHLNAVPVSSTYPLPRTPLCWPTAAVPVAPTPIIIVRTAAASVLLVVPILMRVVAQITEMVLPTANRSVSSSSNKMDSESLVEQGHLPTTLQRLRHERKNPLYEATCKTNLNSIHTFLHSIQLFLSVVLGELRLVETVQLRWYGKVVATCHGILLYVPVQSELAFSMVYTSQNRVHTSTKGRGLLSHTFFHIPS